MQTKYTLWILGLEGWNFFKVTFDSEEALAFLVFDPLNHRILEEK